MQRFPILMYHQIDHLSHAKEPMRGMVVSPELFAAHMALLKRMGCIGMSMAQLMPHVLGRQHTRQRLVGITFDDGYLNNLTHALPVLQAHGFGATCYVVSGRLGQTNAWDHPPGVPGKSLMSEAQLRQWQDGGQDIGSHSHTHADLSTCPPEALGQEIAHSRQHLQALFGRDSAQHFCYPYGRYNADTVEAVRQAGFESATTTRRSRATADHAPLELPRVLVSRTTGRIMLAAKLFSAYEDRRSHRV